MSFARLCLAARAMAGGRGGCGAMARRLAALAGLALTVGVLRPPAAGARELWRHGDASLELSGSVRELATVTKGTDARRFDAISVESPQCLLAASFPDCPAFDAVGKTRLWQSLTRVRTRLDAHYGTHIFGEVVYDHELRVGTLDTFGRSLGDTFRVDPLVDLDWDVHVAGMPSDRRSWHHRLYRAFVRLESGPFEAVIGRQRIAWGVGRLWQPTDRFNFVPPLAVEPDETLGVDALDLRWNASGFDFLEAVYQPNAHRRDDAFGLRWHGSVRDVDYSLLGGRWVGAWAIGGDLTGNLGQAAFRLEAVWTRPTRDVWPVTAVAPRVLAPFWQVVAGVDGTFDWGSGLYVLVEQLYNGNALGVGKGRAGVLLPFFEATREAPAGLPPLPPGVPPATGPFVRPASVAIFGGSRVITNTPYQTGLQVGYDLTAILHLDVLGLWDWEGGSGALVPVLKWSPTNSLEITVGAQLFSGGRHSQYGTQDPLGYAMVDWFF